MRVIFLLDHDFIVRFQQLFDLFRVAFENLEIAGYKADQRVYFMGDAGRRVGLSRPIFHFAPFETAFPLVLGGPFQVLRKQSLATCSACLRSTASLMALAMSLMRLRSSLRKGPSSNRGRSSR